MKTLKQIIAVILIITTVLTSCSKEDLLKPTTQSYSKSKKSETTSAAVFSLPTIYLHCSPYRDVVGYTALVNEFNNVIRCTLPTYPCTFHTNQVKTKTFTNYVYSNLNIISVATQNQIRTDAQNWANANAPAGYSVFNIVYSANIIVGSSPTSAGVKITVTYYKCNTTGGA